MFERVDVLEEGDLEGRRGVVRGGGGRCGSGRDEAVSQASASAPFSLSRAKSSNIMSSSCSWPFSSLWEEHRELV